MQDKIGPVESLLGMTATGLMVGLGQLLGSKEKLTWRLVIGRALSSVGLALIAGVALIQIPNIHIVALIGLSALFASLGTSAIEKAVQHYLGVK